MKFIKYLKALRLCADQCFNANQVTRHEYEWLGYAVKNEEEAFMALPKWARIAINKYLRPEAGIIITKKTTD